MLFDVYRNSRVGFVTPLRDGMNLVAKEYVAAQNPNDPGVLILSRFAGAAEQMKEALIVNPYDVEEMADTIKMALEMGLTERQERHPALLEGVRRHDTFALVPHVPRCARGRWAAQCAAPFRLRRPRRRARLCRRSSLPAFRRARHALGAAHLQDTRGFYTDDKGVSTPRHRKEGDGVLQHGHRIELRSPAVDILGMLRADGRCSSMSTVRCSTLRRHRSSCGAGGLAELLVRISKGLGGAMAVLTGRQLAEIDTLLAPAQLIGAGVHGSEMRTTPAEPSRASQTRCPTSLVRRSRARARAARHHRRAQGAGPCRALPAGAAPPGHRRSKTARAAGRVRRQPRALSGPQAVRDHPGRPLQGHGTRNVRGCRTSPAAGRS